MNSIRRISRTAIVLLATVSAVVGTFAVTAEASHLRGALGSAVYDPTAKTVTIRTELLQRKNFGSFTFFAFPTIWRVDRTTGAMTSVTRCTGQNTTGTQTSDTTSQPLFDIDTSTYVVDVSCVAFSTKFDYLFSETANNRISGIKNTTNLTIEVEAKVRVDGVTPASVPVFKSGYMTNVPYDPTATFTTNLNASASDGTGVTYSLVTNQTSAVGGYGASRIPCSNLNASSGAFTIGSAFCTGTETYATAFGGGTDALPIYYALKVVATDSLGQSMTRDVLLAFSSTTNRAPVYTSGSSQTLSIADGTTRDITLSATDPDGNTVNYATDGLPSWATLTVGTPGVTTSAVLHLAPPSGTNTTARVTISAYDNATYPLSSTVQYDLQVGSSLLPPNAPTISTVTAGNNQLSVTFTAPVGGGTVASYSLVLTPVDGSAPVTVTCAAPPTTCVVTGLTNNLTYSLVMNATNAQGTASSVAVSGTPSGPRAPSITINPSAVNALQNHAYASTLLTITNAGDAATSWSISPTPPTGLTFSTSTGALTGTATVLQAATRYTVTATNSLGSSTATVDLAVIVTSQTINFTQPWGMKKWNGTSVQALTATSTSGNTVTFAIASGSTAGCTIVNSNQVQITSSSATGTCTVAANQAGGGGWDAAPTVYKSFMVFTTGSTTSGSCSTSTSRVYSTAPLLYLTNSTVTYQMTSPSTSYTTSNSPYSIINAGAPGASFTAAGVPTACAISTTSPYGFKVSPTGPSGLTFGTSNGIFTGTPTTKQSYSVYNITATVRSSTGTYTSTAVALNARVLGIAQTITFGSIADKVVTVAPFTVSASASSTLTVSFTSATTSVCTVSGSTVTLVAAGTCTITANQSGSSSYEAAPAVSQSFTVTSKPIISLSQSSATFNVNTLIGSPYSITNTGGPATSYAISPAAPDGMAFDTTTGLLSGAPELGQSATPYSITATNSVGTSNPVTFTITINKASQTITFDQFHGMVVGDTQTVSATTSSGLTTVNTVDTPTVCHVVGATLVADTAGVCKVTASQPGDGSYLAATPLQRSVTVASVLLAPSLVIDTTSASFYVNLPLFSPYNIVNVGGNATSFSITPSLPADFTFDPASGSIVDGTPSTVGSTQYAIRATNAAGTSSPVYFTLDIVKRSQSIDFPALNGMYLSSANQTLAATASSGLAVSYGIDPASTGICSIVSGKVHAIAGGVCTVTADQSGSGNFLAAPTVTQSFTILAVPAISVSPSTVTLTAGVSANSAYSITNTGGAATFFSVTPALPNGLTLDSTTGLISGTPSAYTASATYSLTAQNAAGTGTTTTFTLAVQKQNQSITFPVLNAAVLTDATTTTQTLAATSSSGLPITYSLAAGSSSVCSLSGDTITATAAGTCTVNANQSGDTVYSAATQVARSFTVYAGLVAPNISLSASQGTYTYGIDVGTPYTVANSGGPASGYVISPAIGAGLTFDTTTGEISGAPTSTLSATTYTVTATNASGSSSATFQLTVQKATATVMLSGLTPTYTGSPLAVTATTNPAALTVNVTYNGSATAPTNAGSYTVVATISNANYIGTITDTLVIAKATASVSLSNLTKAYTGSALTPTVTTTPSNLAVHLTFDGSATAPTRAGGYTVQVTVDDTNYNGSTSGTFTITAVTPSAPTLTTATPGDGVIVVEFTAGADGGANITDYQYSLDSGAWTSAGGVSSPLTISGLTNGVTYGVRLRAVTSAGSSTASNSLSAMPYSVPAVSALSSASVTHVAATINATVAANGSGTTVVVVWSTDPLLVTGTTSVTADQSPLAATAHLATTASLTGLPASTRVYYMVTATNSAGSTSSAINSFTTSAPPPGAPSISISPASGLFTYGVGVGVPYAITSTGGTVTSYSISPALPAGLSFDATSGVISGTPTTVTASTTYTITAHNITGDSNATFRFGVGQAAATLTLGSLSTTYDSTTKAVSYSTSPAGLTVDITYDGSSTAPTAAGSYAVSATVNDANYFGMATGTLVINKATATISFSNLTTSYDGTGQGVNATSSPVGLSVNLTYDGLAAQPVNAGDYAVVATIDDPNYTGTATDTFTIEPAVTALTISGLDVTYDGNVHTATLTSTPAGVATSITYDGGTTAPTNAGTYLVGARVTNPNYTGSTSAWMHIAPAAASITLTGLVTTYDGNRHAITVTTSPSGLGVAVTYDGGNSTAPLAAGDHSVHVEITDPNYTGTTDATLTIAKATAAVNLSNLTTTYDGTPKAASYTTTPAGLTVDLTYDGSSTAPSAQGSYAVVATVRDNNYTGSATGTLLIANALATVTISGLSATYDGTPHAAQVSTDPVGLAVDVTYNGSSTVPTDAGTYTVVASVNDPNWAGTATSTLVIDKAVATVTLGSLAATYDGTPHAASVVTTPVGLTVDLTYNGSPTAPTHAGSYTVMASVNDTNYLGTASDTLVIDKAVATVALGSLSATYDGTPHAASITTSPTGLAADVTYNASSVVPTDAGTYTVVATINDQDYTGTGTDSLVIDKAPATITLADLNHVFDGLGHSVTPSTTPSGLTVIVTYNGSLTLPVNAGSYNVVATIDDGNYTGSATAQMVIGTAAGAATITLGSLTATYDGSAHSATATANPAGLTVNITYDGSATAPTNAGTYAVAATVDQVVAGIRYTGTATAQLVISKATTTITLTSLSATFNGSGHHATATTTPSGLTVDLTYDGSTTAPVHAGSYVVLAVVNDPNYTGTTTDTLVIGKATAAVNLGSLTLTYLGTPLRPTANTSPVGLSTQLTFNGSLTAPSSAGSYTVVATVTDPDYDGTATVTFQIEKASTALTLSNTAATYDGTSHAVTVTSVPTVAGLTVTYDGRATPPTDAGIYDVTATVDDPNRQGTASGTLVISPADATVGITGVDPVYDGRQHPVVVTTDPAGLTVTVTYNGSTTAPFSAGTYTVVATVTNPNYTGTASARYTMHPAPIAPVLVSGAPPEILPGDGTAIDGSGNVLPVTVTVSATTGGNTVELTDGFITLNVDPIDPGSITSNPDGSQTLAVGKTVSVTGNGFDPFSIVQIWMFSQPRLLATVRVGADGSFVQPVLVPTDLAVGDHTMQVHGYDHHHTHRSLQVGVRIAARQTGVLPATGTASMHLIELAFALLGLGLALRRLARRTASVR